MGTRILICAVFVAVMTLVLGAVRVNDGRVSREKEREAAAAQSGIAVEQWTGCMRLEDRDAWQKLVRENPVMCLRATHTPLKPLP